MKFNLILMKPVYFAFYLIYFSIIMLLYILHIEFKKNITNLHDKNWDNISKFFF